MLKKTIIKNREELGHFFQDNPNPYSTFILNLIDRDPRTLGPGMLHKHHMIPLHANGPDEPFNLILLTLEEHIAAHQLLFDVYESYYDLAAVNMMQGRIAIGEANIRKANQEKMKRKKKGFYDTKIQTELASRPKKQRECYARNDFVTQALARGFDLEHVKTGDVIRIGPEECSSLNAVVESYLEHPTMSKRRIKWYASTVKQQSMSYPVTGFTRSLTGHRDNKGKSVFTFLGFRILGINISLTK